MTVEVGERLALAVCALAEEAARAILAIYETDFEVHDKADGSPVTEADLIAHRIISQGLRALDPAAAVVSEEGDHPDAGADAPPEFWLVDPLDGTRGFARRSGDFTVNIALVRGTRPVLGVVQWPVRGVCYYGGQGLPAVRCDADGSRRLIHTADRDAGPMVVVASRSRRNPLTQAFVDGLEDIELQRRGSALKSCLVAEGAAHLYPAFSETWYWDTAAPQAVLEAAGGALTDLLLRPLTYDLTAGLRNPRFVAFGASPEHWQHALPPRALREADAPA